MFEEDEQFIVRLSMSESERGVLLGAIDRTVVTVINDDSKLQWMEGGREGGRGGGEEGEEGEGRGEGGGREEERGRGGGERLTDRRRETDGQTDIICACLISSVIIIA